MSQRHIVVVGAGLGGLATAARLAHRGAKVTVLEKNAEIGGRAQRIHIEGCTFDAGPTLLMMLDPFRKLFADLGESFEKRVPHRLCDPLYRVFYADGSRLESTADAKQMQSRLRELVGDQDAAAYPGFLQELGELYDAAIPNFVRKNYGSVADFASPAQLGRVVRHKMLGNLGSKVAKRFRDPRTQMLFSFQAMYLGLSPFDAPWVYGTLAYMEYGEGIFYPEGGIGRIADEVAAIACERGATIRTNACVEKIEGSTVWLSDGSKVEADAVVANADMPYAQRALTKRPPKRKLRYSCSAHMMYIAYRGELSELRHHNVFFGQDFAGNLDALFHNLRVPEDPAFYVCISKLSEAQMAPDGMLNVMVLIPIPNQDRAMTEAEVAALEKGVLDRLTREVGLDQSGIVAMRRRTSADWQHEFNLEKGAAFGISHDLFQSAFMRPQNRDPHNEKLFYVGASTVPGNGMPMVLISAELLEQRLVQSGVVT